MSKLVGDFPLEGKIVVITGGGSGIGLALAKLCLSHNAKVLIADLKLTPGAEKLVKDNKTVVFAKCDVTKWDDLHDLIKVSEKEFGDVPDVYAANAGIFEPPWSNFWNDAEKERYAEVDINVNHPIKLTRIAMRALLSKNKKGVVLITSSVAGLAGNYVAALYCATKHAMVGFVKSMSEADELEGVKVVAICPGIVMSPLWTDRSDSKMKDFDVKDDTAITTDQIAAYMADLIQKGEYPGGTVMMGLKDKTEVVFEGTKSLLRGPNGETIGDIGPAKEIVDRERGKGS